MGDDEVEAWLEEWDEAERHAAHVVREALTHLRGAAPPAGAIAAAAAQLRAGVGHDQYPLSWIRRAAGLSQELPADDTELLLTLLAATISPKEQTGLPAEEESALLALELGDWAATIIELARAGLGASGDPDALADAIQRCPEIEAAADDPDDSGVAGLAFELVGFAWEATGALDQDRKVTPLGVWALPRALTRAWNVDFDTGEPNAR